MVAGAIIGLGMFGKQIMGIILLLIFLIALGIAFLFIGVIGVLAIAMVLLGFMFLYKKQIKLGGILVVVGFILLALTQIGVF